VKTGVVLLSLMLGLALAAGPANTPGTMYRTSDRNPAAAARAPYGTFWTQDDPPETVWTRDVQHGTAGAYQVGVTSVQDSLMWVSAGQSQLKIYIYKISDPARPEIDSFPETGGPSGWGIRDMAYKASTDEVFAGFDNQRYHVYNATTHVPNNTYTVSGYSGTVRGFGYSPSEDSCWTCNFTTSPMAKFSITGTNGHQVVAAGSMASSYGIAYDATSGCFWITQAGVAGTSPIWKMTYPGYAVVDSFNPSGWDLGGGAEMWRGDTFLLALEQGSPDDMVWCFRIITGGPLAHDVGVGILSPPTHMSPGTVTPKAMIRNAGANPERGIPVTCWIDSAGTRVYNQTTAYPGPLAPGASDSIAMPVPWSSGPAGNVYDVTFFTALPGDLNPLNDTARQQTHISGAIFADTLVVKRIEFFAPTIDGVINPDEWAASNAYDISDLLGRGGSGAQPPGSCIAYFIYDDNFMYYAMDCPYYAGRIDYDQFGPYMDEDRSGTWSTDSSEGNYWMEHVGGDSAIYRALLDIVPNVWLMGQAPDGVHATSNASGHLQFEAKVAFGTSKWQYTVQPGDTVGYFQYTQVGGAFNAWWPQSLLMANWANPAYYGPMIFDPNVSVGEGRQPGRPYALYRATPSPVFNNARIGYYVGRQSNVNLGIYDAKGALVKTLASGRMQPGERTAVWNRTDSNGRRVANGTYFYRLTVDGEAVSGKAVVLN